LFIGSRSGTGWRLMGEGFISVRGVTRRFVKDSQVIEVLRGVDLEVQRGEAISIVGASGVGKSTLIHIMGTLDRPTTGSVLYGGQDVFRLDERGLSRFRNRAIGFVFQFHHLLPELSALENAMMPGLISGMSRPQARSAAKEMLAKVGLSHRLKHKPGELSGGELQRVAIARALVLKPQVILADEPTGNLDRRTGERVEDLLLEMHRELCAILVVVTHNPALAKKMDRRLELVDGRFVEHDAKATQGEAR